MPSNDATFSSLSLKAVSEGKSPPPQRKGLKAKTGNLVCVLVRRQLPWIYTQVVWFSFDASMDGKGTCSSGVSCFQLWWTSVFGVAKRCAWILRNSVQVALSALTIESCFFKAFLSSGQLLSFCVTLCAFVCWRWALTLVLPEHNWLHSALAALEI